jgi:hypothetical protein
MASTHDGSIVVASASASFTSPGYSGRIPFAPMASGTLAKFGFLKPTRRVGICR